MNNIKYNFTVGQSCDYNGNNSNNTITRYYQVALFPNPNTSKYNVRMFFVNYNNEYTDIKTFNITKKQLKQFLANTNSKQYKMYSVYTLDNVNYPLSGEILLSKSDILENDYNYTGFAPV
jgi:hypothetical protein